ncbi:hypothetical protein NIES3787_40490 [Microcystis aeruginosa NIES-3787]|uniref:Uncharacterized protein n=1 Tax=Microcystis aeruginosa NIES-3787 TaxID=2517782 RepID=A0A6H9GL46_MICAE|nr:hypothetical protein NIES3787_40490 [Microcystis aeruginosa NIES-3787]
MSPMLEKNCLLLSGNESLEKLAQKIKSLTGIAVPHSTQQRLVHRYHFEELSLAKDVGLSAEKIVLLVQDNAGGIEVKNLKLPMES